MKFIKKRKLYSQNSININTVHSSCNSNVLLNKSNIISKRTKNTKRSKKPAKHAASTSPTTTIRCWPIQFAPTLFAERDSADEYVNVFVLPAA